MKCKSTKCKIETYKTPLHTQSYVHLFSSCFQCLNTLKLDQTLLSICAEVNKVHRAQIQSKSVYISHCVCICLQRWGADECKYRMSCSRTALHPLIIRHRAALNAQTRLEIMTTLITKHNDKYFGKFVLKIIKTSNPEWITTFSVENDWKSYTVMILMVEHKRKLSDIVFEVLIRKACWPTMWLRLALRRLATIFGRWTLVPRVSNASQGPRRDGE